MKIKWCFRNEQTQISNFSETPAFSPKFSASHLNFLLQYFNFSHEEWKIIRFLAKDRSIITKKADKGSCVVVWNRADYSKEAEEQMAKNDVYKEVTCNEKMLSQLVSATNQCFECLVSKGYILEKLYRTYKYKRTCNLCKLF